MSREATSAPTRCLLVWGAATGVAALLEVWLLPDVVDSLGGPDPIGFVPLLVVACEAATAGCVGWLWLLVTLVVHEALRGRRRGSGVPAVVRRLVLAACGLSLAGGLLAPAHAADGDPVVQPAARLLVGLPVPDRMTTAQWLGAMTRRASRVHAAAAGSDREPHPPRSILVRPGDSLWAIAERSLPAGADAAAIDRHWRRIYHVNRPLIGPDPDLLRPGQRLRLPDRTSP